jgi:hypothetical protein
MENNFLCQWLDFPHHPLYWVINCLSGCVSGWDMWLSEWMGWVSVWLDWRASGWATDLVGDRVVWAYEWFIGYLMTLFQLQGPTASIEIRWEDLELSYEFITQICSLWTSRFRFENRKFPTDYSSVRKTLPSQERSPVHLCELQCVTDSRGSDLHEGSQSAGKFLN